MATVDDKKVIFSMVGVSKIIPQNQKHILKKHLSVLFLWGKDRYHRFERCR